MCLKNNPVTKHLPLIIPHYLRSKKIGLILLTVLSMIKPLMPNHDFSRFRLLILMFSATLNSLLRFILLHNKLIIQVNHD